MLEDNTPTVNAKTRKPTSHKRLRLEKAKLDQKVTARIKAKKEEGRSENDKKRRAATAAIKSREPRVKKNTLQQPAVPKAKFRKRQIHKAWLPTHLYHTKRARMTPPKEPLWRMAIPLAPTQKSFRPTHRAAGAQGALAWDMSYMSTIGLEGTRTALVGLMKNLGVAAEHSDAWWKLNAQRWLSGTRSWSGMLYEHKSWPTKSIAPVTIVWQVEKQQNVINTGDTVMSNDKARQKPLKTKAFLRVHPAAFLRVWNECLKLAKLQKPAVAVEDLRFEIGSVEVIGPASTEALHAVLQPSDSNHGGEHTLDCPEACWHKLRSVSNPSALPCDAVIAFDFKDPRFRHPLRTIKHDHHHVSQDELLQLLTSWPIDRTQGPPSLFERQARVAASRQLPSQKAINRRKALAAPGTYPEPSATDPKIPVMLLNAHPPNGGQGTWVVLLPWKCVMPVWYSLMHYPLSTGGTLRFGGLQQKIQTTFEAGMPWFPGDYPGTTAGMEWEAQQQTKRKADWEKRPKGKRINYENLSLGNGRRGEIGQGWACDWQLLANYTSTGDQESPTSTLYHLNGSESRKRLQAGSSLPNDGALSIVKITMLQRGVPAECGRIYRMPSTDSSLRSKCLAIAEKTKSKYHSKRRPTRSKAPPPPGGSAHARRQALAASLLHAPPALDGEDDKFPPVPEQADLIGFVTSGNFNLADGKGSGIGSILLDRATAVPEGLAPGEIERQGRGGLCIVRDSGQGFGRLARWDLL